MQIKAMLSSTMVRIPIVAIRKIQLLHRSVSTRAKAIVSTKREFRHCCFRKFAIVGVFWIALRISPRSEQLCEMDFGAGGTDRPDLINALPSSGGRPPLENDADGRQPVENFSGWREAAPDSPSDTSTAEIELPSDVEDMDFGKIIIFMFSIHTRYFYFIFGICMTKS